MADDFDLDAIEATARRKGYTDLYSGLALVAEVRRLRAIEDAAAALVDGRWWKGVEQRQEHQLLDRRAALRDALEAGRG